MVISGPLSQADPTRAKASRAARDRNNTLDRIFSPEIGLGRTFLLYLQRRQSQGPSDRSDRLTFQHPPRPVLKADRWSAQAARASARAGRRWGWAAYAAATASVAEALAKARPHRKLSNATNWSHRRQRPVSVSRAAGGSEPGPRRHHRRGEGRSLSGARSGRPGRWGRPPLGVARAPRQVHQDSEGRRRDPRGHGWAGQARQDLLRHRPRPHVAVRPDSPEGPQHRRAHFRGCGCDERSRASSSSTPRRFSSRCWPGRAC